MNRQKFRYMSHYHSKSQQLLDFKENQQIPLQISSHQNSTLISPHQNMHINIIDCPDIVYELDQHKFPQTVNKTLNLQYKSNLKVLRSFPRHKSQNQYPHSFIQIEEKCKKIYQNKIIYKNYRKSTFGSNYKQNTHFQSNTHQIKLNQPNKQIKQANKQRIKTGKQQLKQKYTSKQKSSNTNVNPTNSYIFKKGIQNSKDQKQQKKVIQQNYTLNSCYFGWKKINQRKKYSQVRQLMDNRIQSIEMNKNLNFSDIFKSQQLILRDVLSNFIIEIKKQCIQKGQLIQYIWNKFFSLIDKTLLTIQNKNKQIQKSQLSDSIQLHNSYQQFYNKQMSQIKQQRIKYEKSNNFIDKMVYELRLKRKEIKKLYKTIARCNQTINQYKKKNINLQNNYLELLTQSKRISQQQASNILLIKYDMNQEKNKQLKVGQSKQKVKLNIKKQILAQKIQLYQVQKLKVELIDKLSTNNKEKLSINNKDKLSSINGDKLSSNNKDKLNKYNSKERAKCEQSGFQNKNNLNQNFIQQFLQKYSSKCIQIECQQKVINPTFTKKVQRRNYGQNTQQKIDNNQMATQATFSDKFQFDLINSRGTQTKNLHRIKLMEDAEVQADGDKMRIILIKAKMMCYSKTVTACFKFKNSSSQTKLTLKLIQNKKQNNYDQIQEQSLSDFDSDQSNQQSRKNSKNQLYSTSKKNKTKTSIISRNSKANKQKINLLKKQNAPRYSISSFHRKKESQLFDKDKVLTIKKSVQNRISGFGQKSLNSPSKQYQIGKKSMHSPMKKNNQAQMQQDQRLKCIQKFTTKAKQQYQVYDPKSIFQTFKNAVSQEFQLFDESQKEIFLNQQNLLFLPSDIFDLKKNTFVGYSQQNELLNNNLINCSASFQINRQLKKQFSSFLSKVVTKSVKKSMVMRKLDQYNFMVCKEKSQYFSITDKLQTFMLDVNYLITQNLSKKKFKTEINVKSANKMIMMTFSKAIDKMNKKTQILQNLIKPLFQSFQLIYGALKPRQIYKKMIVFISQVSAARQDQNFKEFLFFLGLDKKKPSSAYLTTFDVCLFLKLLEKLNLGNKIGYQIQNIRTSKSKVNNQLYKILLESNISKQVAIKVTKKVYQILQKVQQIGNINQKDQKDQPINLFKVSRMIVQEIIKIRMNLIKKLQFFIDGKHSDQNQYLKIKIQTLPSNKVRSIIECCPISTLKKLFFIRAIQQLSVQTSLNEQQDILQQNKDTLKLKKIKKNQLAVLILKSGILDFDYFENQLKNQNIQLHNQKIQLKNQKIQLKNQNNQTKNQNIQISNENDKEEFQAIEYRKGKINLKIQKLNFYEKIVNQTLESTIGSINILYDISSVKLLQHSIGTTL